VNTRGLCQLKLAFIPIVETIYKGTAFLETEEGSFPIELIGKSESPKISVNKKKISIRNVMVNTIKSGEILISNKCSIPLTLKINFTNNVFFSDER